MSTYEELLELIEEAARGGEKGLEDKFITFFEHLFKLSFTTNDRDLSDWYDTLNKERKNISDFLITKNLRNKHEKCKEEYIQKGKNKAIQLLKAYNQVEGSKRLKNTNVDDIIYALIDKYNIDFVDFPTNRKIYSEFILLFIESRFRTKMTDIIEKHNKKESGKYKDE